MNALSGRGTILLLALAQAFYSCSILIVFSTASLVGLTIAPDRSFATLPITTFVIGAMVSTVPASFLMQRYGRKPVFLIGAASAMVGSSLAVWAIFHSSFYMFCAATLLQGVFQATSSFNTFAATEAAKPEDKSLSISWVLTGGVVAAILGSFIARHTAHLYDPFTFAGSYGAAAVLSLFASIAIFSMNLPMPQASEISGPQRAWPELLRQKRLVAAMAAAIISYGLMNLMMTAAPVAMHDCGFTNDDGSFVIQWHVLGMFVPSFFTGLLIKRFGVNLITSIGLGILITAGIAALLGITFGHFVVALVLLGIGWNFGFIGGTTMLTECYTPSERAKVQGVNNFLIAALQTVTSLASGAMLTHWGWASVPLAVMPIAAVILVLVFTSRKSVAA